MYILINKKKSIINLLLLQRNQKNILLKIIKNKSVVAWEHINFGKTYVSDQFNLKREQLLNVKI